MVSRRIDQTNLIRDINLKIDARYKQLFKKFNPNLNETKEIDNLILAKKIKRNSYDIQAYKITYIKENSVEKELESFNNLIVKFYNCYEEFNNINTDQHINTYNESSLNFNPNIIENFKNATNTLNGDIQKLYYLIVAEKASNINFPIYICYYYDFRGRMYPNSAIGFTYMKAIRSLYYFPNLSYSSQEIKNSTYFNQIIEQKIDLKQFYVTHPINKYFSIIHFLELGKLFKGKAYNLNNGISLQDFVDIGINAYVQEDFSKLKIEDYIYANNLKNNLYHFYTFKKFQNITIIRDSTASFLQH
jgi:3-methyladenine DNA glycosylase Tag